MDSGIIIFSGFNTRAIISFCRTAEELKVPYAIVAVHKTDPIFKTDFAQKVCTTRNSYKLDRDDISQCIQKVFSQLNWQHGVVAPSSEALNRFFLEHRDYFSERGIKLPLVEEAMYECISDKYAFAELCSKYGILIPKDSENISEIQVPMVAKPKEYGNYNEATPRPILILTEKEKASFLKLYEKNLADFFYQSFIEGDSYYLLYYFHENGDVLAFSQQNIAQQHDGKSIVAARSSTIHEEPISALYVKLFKEIQFRGLVMVEVMKNNDDYVMIEANPRFWGPSQLFVDAGVNFFAALLFDQGFISEKLYKRYTAKKQDISYCWFGGFVQTWSLGKSIRYFTDELRVGFNIQEYFRNDIYRRTDTIALYKDET